MAFVTKTGQVIGGKLGEALAKANPSQGKSIAEPTTAKEIVTNKKYSGGGGSSGSSNRNAPMNAITNLPKSSLLTPTESAQVITPKVQSQKDLRSQQFQNKIQSSRNKLIKEGAKENTKVYRNIVTGQREEISRIKRMGTEVVTVRNLETGETKTELYDVKSGASKFQGSVTETPIIIEEDKKKNAPIFFNFNNQYTNLPEETKKIIDNERKNLFFKSEVYNPLFGGYVTYKNSDETIQLRLPNEQERAKIDLANQRGTPSGFVKYVGEEVVVPVAEKTANIFFKTTSNIYGAGKKVVEQEINQVSPIVKTVVGTELFFIKKATPYVKESAKQIYERNKRKIETGVDAVKFIYDKSSPYVKEGASLYFNQEKKKIQAKIDTAKDVFNFAEPYAEKGVNLFIQQEKKKIQAKIDTAKDVFNFAEPYAEKGVNLFIDFEKQNIKNKIEKVKPYANLFLTTEKYLIGAGKKVAEQKVEKTKKDINLFFDVGKKASPYIKYGANQLYDVGKEKINRKVDTALIIGGGIKFISDKGFKDNPYLISEQEKFKESSKKIIKSGGSFVFDKTMNLFIPKNNQYTDMSAIQYNKNSDMTYNPSFGGYVGGKSGQTVEFIKLPTEQEAKQMRMYKDLEGFSYESGLAKSRLIFNKQGEYSEKLYGMSDMAFSESSNTFRYKPTDEEIKAEAKQIPKDVKTAGNIALFGLGLGAGALPNAVRLGLDVGFIGYGGYQAVTGETTGEKVLGVATAGLGIFGLRNTVKYVKAPIVERVSLSVQKLRSKSLVSMPENLKANQLMYDVRDINYRKVVGFSKDTKTGFKTIVKKRNWFGGDSLVYSGNPADKEGYKEALKILVKQGKTEKEARNILRLYRPQDVSKDFTGVIVKDKVLAGIEKSKSNIYDIEGIKTLNKKSVTKKVLSASKSDEGFADNIFLSGKDTQRFIGIEKVDNKKLFGGFSSSYQKGEPVEILDKTFSRYKQRGSLKYRGGKSNIGEGDVFIQTGKADNYINIPSSKSTKVNKLEVDFNVPQKKVIKVIDKKQEREVLNQLREKVNEQTNNRNKNIFSDIKNKISDLVGMNVKSSSVEVKPVEIKTNPVFEIQTPKISPVMIGNKNEEVNIIKAKQTPVISNVFEVKEQEILKPVMDVKVKTSNATKNISLGKSKQKEKSIEIFGTIEKDISLEKTKSKEKEASKMRELMRSKNKSDVAFALAQIQRMKSGNKMSGSFVKPIVKPKIIFPKSSNEIKKTGKSFGDESIEAVGFRFGKETYLGKGTKEKAASDLSKFLKGTLGASGYLKTSGGEKLTAEETGLLKDFIKSKRKDYLVVEQRNRRLKKGSGETSEIIGFRKGKSKSSLFGL